MKEHSHKKGEVYQQDVKYWLHEHRFFGFDLELFGDAYDVSKKACTIGEIGFDFSLKLCRGNLTRYILYCECKFRNEQRGNVNTEFKDFLRRVYRALSAADQDEVESAHFAFVSNVPPNDWREFLRNKLKYCREQLMWNKNEIPEESMLGRMIQIVHILVLSTAIVARE